MIDFGRVAEIDNLALYIARASPTGDVGPGLWPCGRDASARGASPMRREPNRLSRMATVATKASSSVPPKTIVPFAKADNGTSSKAYCSHTSGA